MFTAAQRREFENEVLRKQAEFEQRHDRLPTRVFINRTLYFHVIMEPGFQSQLSGDHKLFGMTVYQVIPLFGSPEDRVVEVA